MLPTGCFLHVIGPFTDQNAGGIPPSHYSTIPLPPLVVVSQAQSTLLIVHHHL